jgi:hypothetical protein
MEIIMQELKYNPTTEEVEAVPQRTAITDFLTDLQNLKLVQKDASASSLKKDLAKKKYAKLIAKLSRGIVPDRSKQYRIADQPISPELQAALDEDMREVMGNG